MSIRAIALELYRAQQQVNRLEIEKENAPPQEKDRIDDELQRALAELKQFRRMLDGAKTESPFTKRPAHRYGH
jgi:uncharacterized protein YicC (UPF0701 family)